MDTSSWPSPDCSRTEKRCSLGSKQGSAASEKQSFGNSPPASPARAGGTGLDQLRLLPARLRRGSLHWQPPWFRVLLLNERTHDCYRHHVQVGAASSQTRRDVERLFPFEHISKQLYLPQFTLLQKQRRCRPTEESLHALKKR